MMKIMELAIVSRWRVFCASLNRIPLMTSFEKVALEHVPQKCARFCDQNMLSYIELRANSYRLGDSAQAESALGCIQKAAVDIRFLCKLPVG